MDRHQVRLALLKVSLVTLIASTWVFWSFIFATRPEESGADTLANLVRLPASLPAQIPGMTPLVKIMEPIAMDVVKLPCWDKPTEDESPTTAHWVRLTGTSCLGEGDTEADASSISVKNLSNGFSATVFPTQKTLTTDFIPLNAGRNEILIRFDREDEAPVETKFNFTRE